jgi:hypothetical protein
MAQKQKVKVKKSFSFSCFPQIFSQKSAQVLTQKKNPVTVPPLAHAS